MLRFAPSPTGDMHIDDLRVAILNYLAAQYRDEPFNIRIADVDKADNIEGKDTEIMQILEKFALKHQSVFHQSEHLHMHQTLAIKLLEEEKAFICTCSAEQIEAEQEKTKKNKITYQYSGKCKNIDKSTYAKLKESNTPFVIRLKKPAKDIIYHDLIQGDIITTPDEVDDFVILRSDGTPTYDFASACDDMISGISLIICKEDNFSNTAKQKHIKTQLGYTEDTIYAHLPNIFYEKDEAYTVKWLFKEGFIPDAIINYLLLLGNINTPKEIFTLPKAIEWFSIEDISKSSEKFNIEKLRSINKEHLKLMDNKKLSTLFGFADEDIGKLAKLYLEEASTVKELDDKIKIIFSPKNFNNKWEKEMRIMASSIQKLPMIDNYDNFESTLIKESGLKKENISKPLSILLTGSENGPQLSDIYPLIKPYLLEVAS